MNASPAQFRNEERSGLPDSIVKALRKIIRQDFSHRVAMFPVLVAICVPSWWLVRAAIDRTFGLSWMVRLLLLLGDFAVIGILSYFHIYLPYKRKLNLAGAALLVERKMPEFRTSLISAVELSEAGNGAPGLIRRLVRSVGSRVEKADLVRAVADTRALKKYGKWAGAILILAGAAFWYFAPDSWVLAKRICLVDVKLPTMTKVIPVTQHLTVAPGADLELAARAEGVIPRNGKLIVTYDDGRKDTVSVLAQKEDAALFSFTMKNARQPIKYHFELNDGIGSEFSVALREVPILGAATFTQLYPKYTGLPETIMPAGNLGLLAGGKLRIEAESSLPLKSATLELAGLERKIPMKVVGEKKREVEAEIPVEPGLTSLSIHLENEKGQRSENDPVYRVQLLNDRPPAVNLLEPKSDKITVVVDDKPTIAYAVRDDYGIASIAIGYEVLRIDPDGYLSLAERGRIPLEVGPNKLSSRSSYVWDLTRLIPPLTVGSSVSYWIEARDNKEPEAGSIKSKKKSFLVVSEGDKKNELIEAMQDKAKSINRISEGQGTINQNTDEAIRGK